MDHIWGLPGSILIHVLVLILLCRLIDLPAPKPVEPDIVVTYVPSANPPPFDPVPPDPAPPVDTDHHKTDIDISAPPAEEPSVPDDEVVPAFADNDLDLGALNAIFDVEGALRMQGLHGNRSETGIRKSLGLYADGQGHVTEPAVRKALEWLRRNQNEDGSWGEGIHKGVRARKYTVGLTGLGLLTFLAHGETPSSQEYGATVERAIKFLISQQDSSGFFVPLNRTRDEDGNSNENAPYAHAIATYAISEAYGMTRIPQLEPVMEKAVDRIIAGQMPDGGWGYGYVNVRGSRKDLSVMGWQIQALKAALMAHASNPGLLETLEKGREAVLLMQVAQGMFAYSAMEYRASGAGTDSMTGVGVLSLQLLGEGSSSSARAGLSALRSISCDWTEDDWGEALHRTKSYDYYYITQAKFQAGGSTWARWNRRMATEIAGAQHEEGYWAGPRSEDNIEHKVYNTTLAALTLEVYYRFLPTYKGIPAKAEPEEDQDGVRVEILDEEQDTSV